jgi:hypothetical protein
VNVATAGAMAPAADRERRALMMILRVFIVTLPLLCGVGVHGESNMQFPLITIGTLVRNFPGNFPAICTRQNIWT